MAPFLISYGQEIDSLKNILKTTTNDSIKMEALGSLAELANDEEWPAYNKQAKSFALKKLKELNTKNFNFYTKCLADALGNEGYLHGLNGQLNEALESYNQSLLLRIQINNKDGISNSYNNMGAIFEEQGNISKALEYYLSALKIREELGLKKNIAISLINIGVLYSDQGDKDKALEYYLRSLKIQEEIGDLAYPATSLNNIGVIYADRKENKKALECHNRSLSIRKKLGDKRQMSYTLNNIGMIYLDSGEKDIIDTVLFTLPEKREKALACFKESLHISKELDDKNGIIVAMNNICYYYFCTKSYHKSTENGELAYEICKNSGFFKYIKSISFNLYRSYKELGKTAQALKFHEIYVYTRDSIRNLDFRKSNFKAQVKYEFQKKAAADSLIIVEEKKVAEAKLENEKTQKYALFGGIGLIGVFALFMVNRFNVIKKQKRIIELKEKETQIQKNKIEEKQLEIIQSIQYAKRIQNSFLPTNHYINKNLTKMINK